MNQPEEVKSESTQELNKTQRHRTADQFLAHLLYRTNWFRLILAMFSGLLLVISFPPFNSGLFGWVALVPLLIAIYTSPSQRTAGLCGFLTGAVFYSVSLSFFIGIFGLFGIILANILSLYIAIFSVSCWLVADRIGLRCSFLLIPFFWTGIEFFRSEAYFLKFPWLSLGYSQAPYLSLIQVCDILGVYGLSFLIITINALIAWFVLDRIRKREWNFGYPVMALLMVILIFIYGITRTSYQPKHQRPPTEKRIQVAVVQEWIGSLDRYVNTTMDAVGGHHETLVVWPEASLSKALTDISTRQRLEALVRDKKLYLVFGNIEPTEEVVRVHNYAVIMSPEGKVIGKYAKRVPVQFIETVVKPGRKWGVFDTDLARIGIFICYEAAFTKISRWIAGKRGAEILVVPTNELPGWGGWSHRIHAAFIPFRAVETRRAILRSTSLGFSMIVHPSGKIESQLDYLASGVLRGEVPLETKRTFYVRYGYHFPELCLWLYLGFLLVWIVLSLLARIREYQDKKTRISKT